MVRIFFVAGYDEQPIEGEDVDYATAVFGDAI
jgi:hypothetical protein